MTWVGWARIREEPYRLLFPLGIVFGCIGVAHWLLYALGASNASPFYHASIQLSAYVYCFMAGFLWTALPRMSGTASASRIEFGLLLSLLAAQAVLLMQHHLIAAQGCYAGLLVLLVAFALRRLAQRRTPVPGPTEFVWIPAGVLFGLLGIALSALGASGAVPGWLHASGRVMAQQGVTLSLVVGVASFMAPRLMGRAHPLVQVGLTAEQVTRVRQQRIARHLVAAGVLGVSFLIEGAGHVRGAYTLRALLVTTELGVRARVWLLPAVQGFYLKLLWLSLWCVIIGLWAVACWPAHRVAMLHLVLIGGFSLMIFAVATMVVLSHAGEAQALQQPLWVLKIVAAGVLTATTARILADLWPAHYFALLALAAVAWLAAGMSWLGFALRFVGRAVSSDEAERLHAAAKQQLMRGEAASC